MLRTHKTISCLALSLAILTPTQGEELIWSTLPLVGAADLKDGKLGEGVVYELQRLIEQALPEFEHSYVISNPKRLIHEMQSGTQRCSTILPWNAELVRAGYFVPYIPTLPLQLIVRADTAEDIPIENGRVSLEKLVQSPRLRGGIVDGRGYPTELQPYIDQGLANQHITAINSQSSGANLLSMISYGRLDYNLEYPAVVKSHSGTASLPHPLRGIPIIENIQMSPAGLYCPRNFWGKSMASRLDNAVRQIVTDPEQLLPMYIKTVDEQLYDFYEPQLRTYLEERAKNPTQL